MPERFCGRFLTPYAQVALIDAESADDSYPQWETGEEDVIFGSKGVVVATAGTTNEASAIRVTIYLGPEEPDEILCASGVIQVGKQGLLFGDATIGDVARIPWPAGETSVFVYVDAPRAERRHVIFVLEPKDLRGAGA